MKTIFNVDILRPGGGGTHVEKTIDLPFAPAIGMEIEQAVWAEPRKIVNVTLNIDEAYCWVYLERERPNSREEVDSTVAMYKDHGWEVL